MNATKITPAPRRLSVWLFGIAIPLLIAVGVAVNVSQQGRLAFEQPLMLTVHQHSGFVMTQIAVALHWVGKWQVASVIVALLALYEWRQKRPLRAVFIVLGAVVPTALMSVAKSFFNRARPEFWPRIVEEGSTSFPSGHSTFAAALAFIAIILCWHGRYRVRVAFAAAVFALLSGYSRVVLGVHYPTDVLVGWLTGMSTVICLQQIMQNKISLPPR